MSKYLDENGHEREDVFLEDSIIHTFTDTLEKSTYHVYGLVGDWGSGKTTFIKLWEE